MTLNALTGTSDWRMKARPSKKLQVVVLCLLANHLLQPSYGQGPEQDSEIKSTSTGVSVSDGEQPLHKVRMMKDVIYQENLPRAGRCDVFLPDPLPNDHSLPTVILVHGGGWIGGDKWNLRGYGYQLAEHGFVAISINYRHAPKHQFPTQVDDVRQAMLWVRKSQKRFNLDLNRIGMFGYSAGGHLTALVGSLANQPITEQATASQWSLSDPRWKDLPEIKALCIGGPPCDFQSLPPDNTSMSFFLGDTRRKKPEVYRAASPVAHVSAGDPPTAIIHGETDIIVPLLSSQVFHEAQKREGVSSQLIILPKHGHFLTFINPSTAKHMISHFRTHLAK